MNCPVCNKEVLFSKIFSACYECIKLNRNNILSEIITKHSKIRKEFKLSETIPHGGNTNCKICANNCSMKENEISYCGLRTVKNNKIVILTEGENKAVLDWYFDPLPTNCVAEWVCSGSKQTNKKNLAVFYGSCSFNCLFCQNWHFKTYKPQMFNSISAKTLASYADNKTYCVCFFGGDPSTQMPHSLATAKFLSEKNIKICWETNGSMNKNFLKKAIELSLSSGGCIKFDLKAFDENIHYALCGVSNKQTIENFKFAAEYINKRREPPLLIASSLLIPGYIDEEEIYKIASFIYSLDKSIPYCLLLFYPSFVLNDLSMTSKEQAYRCLKAAKNAGLVNVKLGNIHLLSMDNFLI
ncbi:MAG: radical SAM protein [Candidatus Goldbacteria bacterium]|nr:radical SAM protein [Candidatus Goldiibacteriota bacterium]